MLIVIVVALMGCTLFLEYAIRTILSLPHRITSYSNPIILIDSLSSSAMTIICLWSMSVIKLFRKWNKKNEDVMMLEQNFLETEVNKLKGQISPIFMSRALRKAALITASDPQKASQILMLLGHLLRYQLYDCNRNKVFLNSEIIFLKNLLQLKKIIEDSCFEYVLEVKGKTNNLLISPLLFIVLIQSILIANEIKSLSINLEISEKKIRFIVNYENTYRLPPEYKMEIADKLNMLYPDLYIFTMESGNISLQLDLKEWK
ncbi:histidine kinase [Sphingobacterium zeae]|uniref:histidine kinase n=1 Tax=Sphingobacterium zeae TaxID=1776859 RepID=UPI0027D81D88|nr:histidine kinase [Sphingobacterium zeae]